MGLLSKLAVKAAKSAAKKAPKAVEKPRNAMAVARTAEERAPAALAVKALPPPPKRLALPAPGPGLPPLASKPRGGQWYPNTNLTHLDAQAAGYKLDNYTDRNGVDRYQVIRPEGTPVSGYVASSPEMGWQLANTHFENDRPFSNFSPENAARMARENYGLIQYNEVGDPEPQAQLGDWLERALAKYYKTEFGSPNDPLRSLAERGLHYDPEMTPERWQREVNDSLMEDPIGYFTVPRHESEIQNEGGLTFFGANDPVGQGALMQAAPWLRKQPVTDMLYGIRGALDLGHFTDEMYNALKATEAGLPMDLAVRPESLNRMTFPQAVEHVGKINQYRAKQMERAALSALDSPAIHTFKEYAEDNPRGLRWVELRAPEGTPPYRSPYGLSNDELDEALREPAHPGERALREALEYEGNTMGHCVGGYCPDVLSGRSRIFSLRDAKGEPHVTVETRPGRGITSLAEIPADIVDALAAQAKADTDEAALRAGVEPFSPAWNRAYNTNLGLKQREWVRDNPPPEDIVQIKGKQNRAPKDDYLPFVQDFVKSQQWGNVGDLANTGLVRLPDGRYITAQQAEEGIAAIPDRVGNAVYDPSYLHAMDPGIWSQVAPYFEGFAIGGRVDPDRCFCRHPMAVKR